jgi:hypothetical protein
MGDHQGGGRHFNESPKTGVLFMATARKTTKKTTKTKKSTRPQRARPASTAPAMSEQPDFIELATHKMLQALTDRFRPQFTNASCITADGDSQELPGFWLSEILQQLGVSESEVGSIADQFPVADDSNRRLLTHSGLAHLLLTAPIAAATRDGLDGLYTAIASYVAANVAVQFPSPVLGVSLDLSALPQKTFIVFGTGGFDDLTREAIEAIRAQLTPIGAIYTGFDVSPGRNAWALTVRPATESLGTLPLNQHLCEDLFALARAEFEARNRPAPIDGFGLRHTAHTMVWHHSMLCCKEPIGN